ncbi:MAG: preprotein translocase subunit SecG [Opitutaceae bacterium]|nr:preprotein translocase subunit SecG [Opitutaceae bacterium]
MSILLGILTFVLILVSLFLVLIVLMQKTKDGGIGAALGGGATEAAFGAETNNVLSKSTIYAAIIFFVLAFVLYLGRIYESKHGGVDSGRALPAMPAAATPAPAAPVAGATAAPAVTVPATAPATDAAAATAPATTPAPAPTPEAPKK